MSIIKDGKEGSIEFYESLTMLDFRAYLNKKYEASKKTITLYMLNCVVRDSIWIGMSDRSEKY